MIDLGTLKIGVDVDNNKANKELDTTEKKVGSFGKVVGNATKSMAKGLAVGVGAMGTAFVAVGGYAVNLASDLQEVQNVVDTTFGANATKIDAWAKNAGTAFGMSELQAKQFTSTMGSMVKSMGLTDEQTFEMSTTLAGLSGDFASFYNLDHEDAFAKIRAGISGETEPLKQLGINMSVANLETFAMSQGMNKAYKDMTQAEQATLRYNYILKAGADAQGDFAKTSDSFANQMRIAKLEIQNTASSLGQILLPAVTAMLPLITERLKELTPAFKNIFGGFVKILKGEDGGKEELVGGVTELVNNFATTITEMLPTIIEVGFSLLQAIVTAILDNLPMIIETGIKCIVSLIQGIAEMLPTLIPQMIDCVILIAETILDNIDLLIDAGIELIINLALGLIEALPKLIEKIPVIIDKLIMAIVNNLPKIIEAGVKLIIELAKGLIKAIPELIKAVPKLIASLVNGFITYGTKMLDVGKNLVKSIWDGICSMGSWLWDKVSGFFSGIWESVKSIFTGKTEKSAKQQYAGQAIDDTEYFATGGILTKATTFGFMGNKRLVGGEAGTEAVIPLAKLPELMKQMGYIPAPSQVQTSIIIDGREVANATTPYIAQELETHTQSAMRSRGLAYAY